MDFDKLIDLIFGMVGGLGIFLLGMKNMSEGMQAVAGSGLRRLISSVTDNRLMATGAGTVVTGVVQSSSITTVMVIGFVNSGLMNLKQGIGVIMGANIGTTVTGWFISLDIGRYGLPILGLFAFIFLFSRQERWRYWEMAIMGVGMVFFGLELMKNACKIIRDLPDFLAWFQQFQADSYFGVLKCALVGCVLTMLVQSSSATLGITMSLAGEGIITFPTAAALVLGENIGTTITAYLASLGTTTNARRAAYFHVIFNIIGVLWITLIFQWYIEGVRAGVEWFAGDPIDFSVTESGVQRFVNVGLGIATTHSVFNILNTLMFLPFVSPMSALLVWLVPDKAYKEKPHLTDLEIRLVETPVIAIEQSRVEILKMATGCNKMLDWLQTLQTSSEPDEQLIDRLIRRERVLDNIQDEVAAFVTMLLSRSVPHSVADEGRRHLQMADEYESISDYILGIWKFSQRLKKQNEWYRTSELEGLQQLHGQVAEYVRQVHLGMEAQNVTLLTKLAPDAKEIKRTIKKLRQEHLAELSTQRMSAAVSVALLGTLNAYARVRDHAENVVELLSEP